MKKVILVTYCFPPVGGAGVQRPLKFVKYLREYGWEPVVLTVSNPSVPVIDESLMSDVPPGTRIYHAKTLEPSYQYKQTLGGTGGNQRGKSFVKKFIASLLVPDIQVLWWPGLIRSLISILRQEKPDCLFVTAPPFSSLIPTVFLGKLFRVPVVIDFRDEWVFARQNLEHSARSVWARLMDHLMEKLVVSLCAKFTAATQGYVESICRRHGSGAGKGISITNGFDEDDFRVTFPIPREDKSAKKVILYSGTIWKATSLSPFFCALKALLECAPSFREQVEVKLLGRFVEDEKNWVEEEPFLGMVSAYGYVSHQKLMEEMGKADLLLLTLSDLPGADRIIPGKTFEYIASGRPILAIVPSGEASKVLKEYSLAHIAHPSDVHDIVFKLKKIIQEIPSTLKSTDNTFKFSRKKLTGDLAQVFEQISF